MYEGGGEYKGLSFPSPGEQPETFQWLVVAYAANGDYEDGVRRAPVMVASRASVCARYLQELNDEEPEQHFGLPIYRVEYTGRG